MKESPLVKAIRVAIEIMEYDGMDNAAEVLASDLKEALKEEGIVGSYRLMREGATYLGCSELREKQSINTSCCESCHYNAEESDGELYELREGGKIYFICCKVNSYRIR